MSVCRGKSTHWAVLFARSNLAPRSSAPAFPPAVVRGFVQCLSVVPLAGVLACVSDAPLVWTSDDRDAAARAPNKEADASVVKDDAAATTRTTVVFDSVHISSDPEAE